MATRVGHEYHVHVTCSVGYGRPRRQKNMNTICCGGKSQFVEVTGPSRGISRSAARMPDTNPPVNSFGPDYPRR